MGVFKARERREAQARLAADVVGFALGVQSESIVSEERGNEQIQFARQVAMYLCYVVFDSSLSNVGAAFARDRSTVAHACAIMEDRRDEPQFDIWIAALETMLRAAPAPAEGRAFFSARK